MPHLNAIAQKDGLDIAVGEDSAIWHVDEASGPTGERISAPPCAAGVALHAVAIRHHAAQLHITLLPLPAYSPDLMPVESRRHRLYGRSAP